MVGCDSCPAVISFISAHPEITMSMPNEDYPGYRKRLHGDVLRKVVVAQPKPERLPDVVRIREFARGKGIQK